MSHEKLIKLITESKQLLKHASPQQKEKIFAAIKESYSKLQKDKPVDNVIENGDYLRED